MNTITFLLLNRFSPVRFTLLSVLLCLATFHFAFTQTQSLQTYQAGNRVLGLHRVVPGQTLYAIARIYNMDVDELKQMNNLNGPAIFPGDELAVVIQSSPASTRDIPVLGNNVNQSNNFMQSPGVPIAPQAARPRQLTDIEVLANIPSMGYDPYSNAPNTTQSSNFYQTQRVVPNNSSAFNSSQPTYTQQPQNNRVLKNEYYRVKQGETIFSIATNNNVSVEQLRAWNAKFNVNAGDIIVIRKYYDQPNPSVMSDPVIYRGSSGFTTSDPYSTGYNLGSPVNATRDVRTPIVNSSGSAYPSDRFVSQPEMASAPNQDIVYHDMTPTYNPPGTGRGNFVEEGAYIPFEANPRMGTPFYGIHKNLPPGSKLRVELPNQSGYLVVEIVGYLPRSSNAVVGLSQAVIDVLREFRSPSIVRIVY